jgi:hypothetical protein
MKMGRTALGLALAGALINSPALAAYKLISANTSVNVGKSALTVTPPEAWNRLPGMVGKKAEAWTLDGLNLNEVTFFGGIASGETLVRERNKKDKPLPKFSASMLAPDVIGMYETTLRGVTDTAQYATDKVEPATFAGQPGFRFNFSYTVGDEVKRKGEGIGAIISGKLYMMVFASPQTHYYDRDIEKFRAIAATARIGSAPKK